MYNEIQNTYQQLVLQYQSIADSKKKQLKLIAFARFFSFIGIVPVYYYLSPVNNILGFGVSLIFLIAFLFLIKKYIQTEKQLTFHQRLVKINQDEIKTLNRDYSSFDPGIEFTDIHHDYSYDLDLYGPGSFFQFLNRTITARGKKKLAELLNQSQRPVNEITDKQAAIQELAEELNWRQNFLAKDSENEGQKTNKVDESIHQQLSLKSEKTIKYLLIIFPPIAFLIVTLFFAKIIGQSYVVGVLLAQWIIFLIYSKTIATFYKQFQSQSKILTRYVEMLQQIETMPFKSNYLIKLKQQLSQEEKSATNSTAELQKILNEFDYRQNILVAFVLNSILLWDVRCIYKLYHWQQNYSNNIPGWFEVIAEIDALISLANCNYNHPDWTTPTVIHSKSGVKSTDLGHPLIDETRCIKNSFQIVDDEQIVIITGANMAGKSTFLRTVGINLILASNGCKVCASSFEFSPCRIYTNMRTSDNLMNDESYFYAELLRLQSMLTLLRKGENLFVILDEMLKGTNSTDKLNGSKELINQLVLLKTHGIVATHDLGLTELTSLYPTQLKNQCFEVQLLQDELKFDYKLTDGVTRTMNATFLMKKMGIIPTN